MLGEGLDNSLSRGLLGVLLCLGRVSCLVFCPMLSSTTSITITISITIPRYFNSARVVSIV